MNRKTFLQTVGSGSAALIIPLPVSPESQQEVVLYHNFVRGLSYYEYNKVQKYIQTGTTLKLKREQSNAHDTFAIEVFYSDWKLGYLPAFENIVLANLMDQGLELVARTGNHHPARGLYECLSIVVSAFLPLGLLRLLNQCRTHFPADKAWDLYRNGHYGFVRNTKDIIYIPR